AAAMAREGVPLNASQAYVFGLLAGIVTLTREACEEFAPSGEPLREGEPFRSPRLAQTIERLRAEGSAPFTSGDIASAIADAVSARGGLITPRALAIYEALSREPAKAAYRGRQVLTNPPPSAGGILLVLAFDRLQQRVASGAPDVATIVAVMDE